MVPEEWRNERCSKSLRQFWSCVGREILAPTSALDPDVCAEIEELRARDYIFLFVFYLYFSLPLFPNLPEVPAHTPTLFSEAGGSQGCLSFPTSYRCRSCAPHSPRVDSTMRL